MNSYDTIIVGSGINGLVCAAMLARKGRRVLVLERNDRPGGCIRSDEITAPGFTHDVLSSWHPLFVTSPGYAELKDELESCGLEYCHTDAPTAVVTPDQRHFILKTSREENIDAMNALAPGDGDRYGASLAALEQSLDLTFTLLGGELWHWRTAAVFAKALLRRGPGYLAQFFGDTLETGRGWLANTFASDLPAACLAPWPLHAGMNPELPAAGFLTRVIAFTLEAVGCPTVRGGNYQTVVAFEKLIRSHGGDVLVDTDVERILIREGRAVGVACSDGREFAAQRAVVCSVTPTQLYQRLLPAGVVPKRIQQQAARYRYGNGDMQIHLALREPPCWTAPELARVAIVHLTAGTDAVSRACNEAERGLLPATATVVVGQQAALDPGRVPEGRGLLWIQLQELPRYIKGDAAGSIPVPADGKWNEAIREAYADRIIERIAQHIPNLREIIIKRTVLSPADLEAININLVGGDPYGGVCSLDQFFLWRPLRSMKNHETPVKHLLHIGASTHPGPGLGGGSGYLVAKRL